MWGRHSHSRKWDLWVLRDFRKFRTRLQGSKHLALRCSLYLGKVLNCRCPKWLRMNHFEICSTSYGWKKGRESNWQLDSRPLKVRNQLDPSAFRWNAIHRRKTFEDSYNFASDRVPIWSWGEKLWTPKVSGVQIGTISRLHFGSPGKKCHSDASATEKRKEYYMGEDGGFPRVRAMVSQVNPRLPVAKPNTKSVQNEF